MVTREEKEKSYIGLLLKKCNKFCNTKSYLSQISTSIFTMKPILKQNFKWLVGGKSQTTLFSFKGLNTEHGSTMGGRFKTQTTKGLFQTFPLITRNCNLVIVCFLVKNVIVQKSSNRTKIHRSLLEFLSMEKKRCYDWHECTKETLEKKIMGKTNPSKQKLKASFSVCLLAVNSIREMDIGALLSHLEHSWQWQKHKWTLWLSSGAL